MTELEKEAVREKLRALVQRDFHGNQTHAAKALGVTQAYVSDVLNAKRAGGMKLIRGMSRYSGSSVIDVGEQPDDATDRYPNRINGARAASIVLGISFDDARRLAPKALHAKSDPDAMWWMNQIIAAHEREEKGLEAPDVRPEDLD